MIDKKTLRTLAWLIDADSFPELDDNDLTACLNAAAYPDSTGKRPGESGWAPTYDMNWAAGCAIVRKKQRYFQRGGGQQLISFTSEGSTFTKTAAEWDAMAQEWFDKSTQVGPTVDAGKVYVRTGHRHPRPRSHDPRLDWPWVF
jgi:hypothetical protein